MKLIRCALVLAAISAAFHHYPALASWPADGLPIRNTPSQITGIAADGTGGVFVNWSGIVQRISAGGDVLFGQTALPIAPTAAMQPCFSDGAGGIFLAGMQDNTIVLIRLDTGGNVLWSTTACQTAFEKKDLRASPDGTGGVVIAWSEDRDLPKPKENLCVYAQRIDPDGVVKWGADGVYVYSGIYYAPHGIYAGAVDDVSAIGAATPNGVPGGALILVSEDNEPPRGLALIVNANGGLVNTLFIRYGYVGDAQTIPDGSGGAFVIYPWEWNGYASARHVDQLSSSPSLAGSTVTNAGSGVALAPTAGGVMLAWVQQDDIYVQKYSEDLIPLWSGGAVPVVTAPGKQEDITMTTDHDGGAMILWTDRREGYEKIYAQHFDKNGIPYLEANGMLISPQPGSHPKVYTDPNGYAIAAWSGITANWAQRLSLAPVAVAISDFTARTRGELVLLSATLRSSSGVDFVKVYRAVGTESFALHETLGKPASDRFEYADTRVGPGTVYRYQLAVGDADGEFVSPIATVTIPAVAFALEQNTPNPFNPETRIHFVTAEPGRARVDVYAPDGAHVKTLLDALVPAGRTSVLWDGTNDHGMPVGSGVYMYRLKAGKFEQSRKMLLLK